MRQLTKETGKKLYKYKGNNFRRNASPAIFRVHALLKKIGVKKIMREKGFLTHKSFILADFYLPAPHRMVIEVDGGYHLDPKQKTYDAWKDSYYRKRGFHVIRITNEESLSKNTAQILLNRTAKDCYLHKLLSKHLEPDREEKGLGLTKTGGFMEIDELTICPKCKRRGCFIEEMESYVCKCGHEIYVEEINKNASNDDGTDNPETHLRNFP